MASPRGTLIASKRFVVENPAEYVDLLNVLDTLDREEMYAAFGTLQDGVWCMHVELLPEGCYLNTDRTSVTVGCHALQTYREKRENELEMKMLGTGHLHHNYRHASQEDVTTLPRLGLDLIQIIHFSGELQLGNSEFYACESEKTFAGGSLLPALKRVYGVKVECQ